MSEVVDGFFKQLRKHVKEKHSNTRIWQFLDTVYKSGYRQGMLDAAAKLNVIAEQEKAYAEQVANLGHDNGGIRREPDSTEPSGSTGADAADASGDTGSADTAQPEQ